MDILSDVSETALITLKARVVEATKEDPIIYSDIDVLLLDKISSLLRPETRARRLCPGAR